MPKSEDIDLQDLGLSKEDLDTLLSLDKDLWREEVECIKSFYDQFEGAVPKELYDELEGLRKRIG